MKLLLDTHAALWCQTDDRRLGRQARHAIGNADIVWVSSASGWEAAIKVRNGKLRMREPFGVLSVWRSGDLGLESPNLLQHAVEISTDHFFNYIG
jgi:PIN domain nuclease of toxin-antitoxin system